MVSEDFTVDEAIYMLLPIFVHSMKFLRHKLPWNRETSNYLNSKRCSDCLGSCKSLSRPAVTPSYTMAVMYIMPMVTFPARFSMVVGAVVKEFFFYCRIISLSHYVFGWLSCKQTPLSSCGCSTIMG